VAGWTLDCRGLPVSCSLAFSAVSVQGVCSLSKIQWTRGRTAVSRCSAFEFCLPAGWIIGMGHTHVGLMF